MKRQAATSKGLKRRLQDLGLDQVHDQRQAAKVKHSIGDILTALVVGFVTAARSLRDVETRTLAVAKNVQAGLCLTQRIADNVFTKVLKWVDPREVSAALHRQVKAEHRRGNLKPTVLPMGTISIDGKNVATLRWHDLCRVLGVDKATATPAEVKALLHERHPELQFCVPDNGLPYALARVHTVTLVSSDAAVCIHQRPTLGHTNEVGSMPELLDELHAAYGRTRLFQMVTADAGNTSRKVAGLIVDHGWDYCLQIKSGHGALYEEACRTLGALSNGTAAWTESDAQNGKVITYRVWQHDLTDQGWLDWTHARQLLRVQRTAEDPDTGHVATGERYYVLSKPVAELTPKACGEISRAHWRCENETHWTADAEAQEDRRRLAWSRHPNGVFVVSLLRRISTNISAVARKLSRLDHTNELPTWHAVARYFLLVLCPPVLNMEAFDADIP